MKATKLFTVVATTAAIFLTAIGVAYSHYITNQTSVNAKTPHATDGGFWGWFGDCLGFEPNKSYGYHYQYQAPSNTTAQPPVTYFIPQLRYQPQNPSQGHHPCEYRRGCWSWQTPFFSFLI